MLWNIKKCRNIIKECAKAFRGTVKAVDALGKILNGSTRRSNE